jgi:hypothetical protein
MSEMRHTYSILGGKLKGEAFRIFTCRWKNNIKIDLKKISVRAWTKFI